jgi:hypothetical protein
MPGANAIVGVTVGAIVGLAAVPVAMSVAGVTAVGPLAGGAFAAA